jgi:4-amino-4-deoxy-L-arabinose transferase-like glycosyltransferase
VSRKAPSLFHFAAVVACLGVLVRVFYVSAFGLFRRAETFEYEVIASNLLAGRGFGLEHLGTWYRSFGGVLFSYLCAVMYATFGHSHLVMLVVQALFSAVTVLGCYSVGRYLFSPTVGLLASVLVAFHPGLFFYDTHKIHPLSFDAALAVLGFKMVLVLKGHSSWRTATLGGVLHSLAIWERAPQIGLLPLALAFMWQSRREGTFPRVVAAYLLAMVAILSPWVARNVIIYRQPVLIKTTSAEIFWRGNNPVASGGAFAEGRPGVPVFDAASEAFRKAIFGKDEITQSKVFFQAAMDYIFHHPADALRLYARKFMVFWWFAPYSGFLYPAGYLLIYKTYYVLLAGLSLVGMAIACREGNSRQRWARVSLIAFLISVAILQTAFYVEIRHRWGIEPLLLIFAARGGISAIGLFYSLLVGAYKKDGHF